MADLGIYWQNRAIEPGSTGNITPSTAGGTAAGSVLAVEVLAASTATGNNTGGLPSNPNPYTNAGGDPSAVQSIVTLNVTNTSTLDLLLAGLMYNTTGGWDAVNGTFQSVTTEVGFLGLGTATTRALPNATEPSDGLWGPPTSEAQSKPTSSLIGEFWNAVTSFVTNPLGTVLSLAYTVWDAAEAAVVYLDHLGTEAAALGAAIKARTAAAIVQVGQIVVKTLNTLLVYLGSIVDAAFAAVIDPIEAGVTQYDQDLNAPLSQAWESENASGSVSQTSADSVGAAFVDNAPFEIALGVSVVVTIVLSVVTTLDLGPSFILGAVIGLVAGAALASIGSLDGASEISSSAVDALASAVNPIKSFPSTEWGTLAGVLGLLAAGEEIPWSWYVMSQAVLAQPPTSIWTSASYVMALSAVALIIGLIAVAHASPELLLLAFVMACVALAGVTYHFLTQLVTLEVPALRQLGWVDVGLSASAMLGSAGDLGIHWHQLQSSL